MMEFGKPWTLMRLGIIFVGLLFFQYLQLSEALARESSSITFGGAGGTRSYNLDCGSGWVMIGGGANAYAHMDQMIVFCRAMNANGTLSEEKYTKGPVGGMGGDELGGGRADCQTGRVVTGVKVEAGRFVNNVQFLCEVWDSSRKEPIFEDSPFRDRIGVSCVGCTRYRTFRCPRGKVAKALRGKSGIYIDSVRLVCDDWNK